MLALPAGSALAQEYQWAHGASTTSTINSVSATATAISPTGDVYTAYNHSGPLTLGSVTYPVSVPIIGDFVLAHYDGAGNVMGSLVTGGGGQISDVEIDDAGNIYAVGRFKSTVQSGGLALTSVNSYSEIFVGKWNAAGTVQWLRHGSMAGFGSQGNIYHEVLAVDANGRVTVAGDTYTMMTITTPVGTTTFPTSGTNQTLFCCQFDAAGNVLWGRTSTSHSAVGLSVRASDLAVDALTGNVLLAGNCETGTFRWTGTPVGTRSGRNIFWMQLNGSDGTLRNSYTDSLQVIYSGPFVAAGDNGHSYLAVSAYQSSFSLNGAPVVLPARSSSAAVVTRLDPNGVPQWVETMAAPDSSFIFLRAIATAPIPPLLRGGAALGTDVYLAGSYNAFDLRDTVRIGSFPLPQTSFQRGKDGYVASLDGLTGTPKWVRVAGAGTRQDEVSNISVSPSGQIAFAGESQGDTLAFGAVRVVFPATRGNGDGFTGKILQSYNLLAGTAYTDANANGQPDAGERTFEGLIVELQPGARPFSTDATGQYEAVAELGTYPVALLNPPLYHTVVTTPAPAAFNSFGNLSTGHDFILQPLANQQDLRVNVTPVGRARPGFPVKYRVTYRNVGTTPFANATVSLVLDPLLTYLSNTGGATMVGTTLTASNLNLSPGQIGNFDVLCQLPTNASLGDTLVCAASIAPLVGDLTPADNAETNRLVITGSFDPNDIQVNYARLTPQQVAGGEWLEYTIRFQNMGTDTAFSVLLRDSLPAQLLNLGTLQLIASSHSCMWGLSGSAMLNVQFTNIRLPHSAVNTVGSMGFVRLRVRPRGTLVIGDLIPNQADIHFDFNVPVTTNTALTEVGLPTGLTSRADVLPGGVWPNPAHDALTVEVNLPVAAPLTLTLLDALGRPVLTRTTAAAAGTARERLEVRGLSAGLYLLRAQAGALGFTRRVVVR